jgi:hypothetical protein
MLPSIRSLLVAAGVLALCASTAGADWPPNPYIGGVRLGAMGGSPFVLGDGAGGTFVAAVVGGVGARVQHLSAAGVPLWAAGGVLAGTSGSVADPSSCALAPDGAGGVIVAWLGASNRAFAQRLDAGGNLLWTAAGVSVGGTSVDAFRVRVCGDGAGGAYVVWEQDRVLHANVLPPITLIRRVDATGALPWSALVVSSASSSQDGGDVVSDGAGGAIVTWSESRGGASGYDIYAQRVNSSGASLWAANGANVCNVTSDQNGPVMASDGAGGAIIAWTDYRGYVAPGYSVQYFVQRIGPGGNLLWFFGGWPVCRATWQRGDLAIAPDGTGGAVMAWDDGRTTTRFDIYAQRFTSAGIQAWTNDGLALCTANADKMLPAIASDGAGGAFVAWRDQRGGSNYDVYATAVSASGTPMGLSNGFPIGAATGDQYEPALGSDGNGAAVAAWLDTRPGDGGVRAQRLDALGYPGDPSPHITSIRDVPNDQGGHVKVSWAASYLDSIPPYTIGILYPIANYNVFRFVQPSSWQLVASVPSGPFPVYSAVVATGGDSSASGPGNAVFRVQAGGHVPPDSVFWYSAPDSGHSIDNLVPQPVLGLAGSTSGEGTRLTWHPGVEPDLAGYRIHRLASAGEAPSAQNLLAGVTGTSFLDAQAPTCVYALVAVDRHDNASAPALLAVTTANPPPLAGASALAFAAPNPNPARDRAMFSFTLPGEATVRIEIFDAAGRRMRALAPGVMSAGLHRIEWDLRDRDGRPVRPGMFCARLDTPAGERTQRVAVVR